MIKRFLILIHLLVTFSKKKKQEKITLIVLKITELYLHYSKAKMCYRVVGVQFIDKHSKLCETKHAKYGSIQTTYFQVRAFVIVNREFIQAYTQYYLLYLHVITCSLYLVHVITPILHYTSVVSIIFKRFVFKILLEVLIM